MCRSESLFSFVSLLVALVLCGCEDDLVLPRVVPMRDAAVGGREDAPVVRHMAPIRDAAVGSRDAQIDGAVHDSDDISQTGSDGGCDRAECRAAPVPLCDGSMAIRLGYQIAGGGPSQNDYGFLHPYGHSFMVIDGLCHYYLNTQDAREGILHGELSAAEAEQISRDVQFAKLPRWSGRFGNGCPDAAGANLLTSSSRLSLSCGCGGCDDAPQGAEEAMNKAGEWYVMLAERAVGLSGSLRALAKREANVSATTPVYDWPLARPMAEAAGLIFEPSYIDPAPAGVLFEGAEANALHELRAKANADFQRARANDSLPPSPVVKDSDSRTYLLYLRDELSPGQAAAISDFFALPHAAPDADAG